MPEIEITPELVDEIEAKARAALAFDNSNSTHVCTSYAPMVKPLMMPAGDALALVTAYRNALARIVELERTCAFVYLWVNRDGLTDAERVSVIKNRPGWDRFVKGARPSDELSEARARAERAERDRDALAEAIEPFAKEESTWACGISDKFYPGIVEPNQRVAHAKAEFSIGDLRRAARVLEQVRGKA